MQALEAAPSLSVKNILLATDFSPGSDLALKHALAIADRHGSDVYTLHVVAPDCCQLLNPEAFSLTFRGWESELRNQADILRGLIQGLPSAISLRPGPIWRVMSEIVKQNHIDLLVLASHGLHGVPHMVLGSLAEDIFRNISCPVLTVGPEVKLCSANEFDVKNVVLASRFEPKSLAPVYAKWIANEFHAELTVLHVVDSEEQSTTVKTALVARTRSILPETGTLWCRPTYVIAYGPPSDLILDVARRTSPDVIVLGAHHPEHTHIGSHLPWATAARVIAEAPCPVLTVREMENHAEK